MTALVVRLAGERVSLRVHRRVLVTGAALALAALALSIAAVASGDYPLSPQQVVEALLGQGDRGSTFIVQTLRLPRVLTALLVGASFGVAGAVFQSISRNPLGSPDVIGFTAGSATGALVVILILGGTAAQVALGAVAGGLVTAVVVYGLAYRGGVQGYRLVLVGIGIGYFLLSVNYYLLTRANYTEALQATHWLVGSLNGRGWEHVWPVAAALAVLLPAAFLLARRLALLELGDDAAHALGVPVERTRLELALVGVALTAVATASTGPIVFVALAAPQIARRLTRSAAPGLGASALMGALLLVASDLLALRLLPRGPARGRGHRPRGRRLPGLAPRPPPEGPVSARLRADDLTLAYDGRVVVSDLGIEIGDGSFTAIVGPNACGKTTLLRALARMMRPRAGQVLLDGQAITSRPSKAVARELGLLPQSSIAPDGITVNDLVARGRYPHQRLLRQWSRDDARAVAEAMAATAVTDLADRLVDELSGGQRQRVWLAMVLAQETPILLLDEPTTFLDIAHQVEVLELCARLHASGRTLVAVLHDLNQACRYATHLVAMRDGEIVAQGDPRAIVTAELVERVFGLACRVIEDPESGTPLVVPRRAA